MKTKGCPTNCNDEMLCYTVCISIVMFVKEIILPEKFNDFHMIVTLTVMLTPREADKPEERPHSPFMNQ